MTLICWRTFVGEVEFRRKVGESKLEKVGPPRLFTWPKRYTSWVSPLLNRVCKMIYLLHTAYLWICWTFISVLIWYWHFWYEHQFLQRNYHSCGHGTDASQIQQLAPKNFGNFSLFLLINSRGRVFKRQKFETWSFAVFPNRFSKN